MDRLVYPFAGLPTRGIKFIYILNLDDLHQLSRLDFYDYFYTPNKNSTRISRHL